MKVKRFIVNLIFAFSLLLLLWQFFIVPNVNFQNIDAIGNEIFLSESELETLGSSKVFGKFVKASVVTPVSKENVANVDLKLFDIFKIKSAKISVAPKCEIYSGGDVLSFKFLTNGVIVLRLDSVLTLDGYKSDLKNSGIEIGDVLLEINGQKITSAEEFVKLVENCEKNQILLKIRRNGVELLKKVQIFKDINGKMRLGLYIKDDFSGVGTLSYIKKNGLEFGAVGHKVLDSETGALVDVCGGEICEASVVGVKKSCKGIAGELRVFGDNSRVIGEGLRNLENGIYGKFNDSFSLENRKTYNLVSRLSVMPGKVKILSCLNGKNVEEFDAEIVKLSKQSSSNQKGILLRITDKRLLNSSGGIVQGMSGSPIVQGDNFVGAVTHVMVDNPSLGYGIFSEWMLQS